LILKTFLYVGQLRIQVSHGSAATDLRRGGRFNTTFLSSISENTTVKELLKSVYICQNYCKIESGKFIAEPSSK